MNFPSRQPQALPTATPTHYVILRNTQHCLHCSTIQESSTIMVKGTLPARMGEISGASVTQMAALRAAPQYNLPIIYMDRPVVQIPFCAECGGRNPDGTTAVSHLPRPAVSDS